MPELSESVWSIECCKRPHTRCDVLGTRLRIARFSRLSARVGQRAGGSFEEAAGRVGGPGLVEPSAELGANRVDTFAG